MVHGEEEDADDDDGGGGGGDDGGDGDGDGNDDDDDDEDDDHDDEMRSTVAVSYLRVLFSLSSTVPIVEPTALLSRTNLKPFANPQPRNLNRKPQTRNRARPTP